MSYEHKMLRYNRIPFHTTDGDQILQSVEKHWEKMREMGPVPAQLSLSPEPLDSALSHCFILERVGDTIARFRVAGQALTHLMGMEARAMPLSAMFTAEGREGLGPLIKAACEGPEIVEIPVTAARGLGRAPLRGRVLLLPLKDRDDEVTQIFGCIVTDGAPRRRVLRLNIDTQIPLRCKRLASTMETMTEVNTRLQKCSTVDLPKDLSAKAPAPPVEHPFLRLVVDNS